MGMTDTVRVANRKRDMADVALSYQQVPLFNAADTIKDCLAIATGVICTMKPKPDNLMKVRTYS